MSWQGMHWIRDDLRLAVLDISNFECVYCGTKDNLGLDHLHPRSKGGNNEPSNLVAACTSCNTAKGDTPWWLFADGQAADRIRRHRRRSVLTRRKKAKAHIDRYDTWKEALSAAIENGI